MNLLPLSLIVFSLLSGNGDMSEQKTRDIKSQIMSRYKYLQVEEPKEDENNEITAVVDLSEDEG